MALSQFLRAAEITQREKVGSTSTAPSGNPQMTDHCVLLLCGQDLMKAIPEVELIQQMKASVKLSAPNLEKAKQQSRKKK